MQQRVKKCLICEYRPASQGGYCHNCQQKIASETARRQKARPEKFLHYRGHWVGLYRAGDDLLKPKYLGYAPFGQEVKIGKTTKVVKPKYPMNRTLNLDKYLDGFTREQIKRMKRCVLKLSATVVIKGVK